MLRNIKTSRFILNVEKKGEVDPTALKSSGRINVTRRSTLTEYCQVCFHSAAEPSWPGVLTLKHFLSLWYLPPRPNKKKKQYGQVRPWIENTVALLSLLFRAEQQQFWKQSQSQRLKEKKKKKCQTQQDSKLENFLYKWQDDVLFSSLMESYLAADGEVKLSHG